MYGPQEEIELEERREEQKRVITIMRKQDEVEGLKEGQTYYIIGSKWWTAWQDAVRYDFPVQGVGPLPPPIDNSALFEDADKDLLKKNLSERFDYIILTKRVWDKLYEWYGGGPVIARKAITTGHWRTTVIELVPLRLQIIYSRKPKDIQVHYFSKTATVQQLLDTMHPICKFNRKRIRVYDFHAARKHKVMTDWSRRLDAMQILDNQFILIEEQRKDGTWPPEKAYQHLTAAARGYGYSAPPSPPGKTGLNNLGNTCFMNSALQCLSATVPLTDFFLSSRYLGQINSQNPLGTKGELTLEYCNLLKQLWSSRVGTYGPRDFKFCLGKFAEQFSGYSQHDSQELLAYLLDGLHEDLNRILRKPYVEIKNDWTADEAWAAHKLRNDSFIVDLFQGQLKSRLCCPNNGKISDQFDPFMYLEVPLPAQTARVLPVVFYPADPTKPVVKYGVSVHKDGSIRDLRKGLEVLTGVAWNTIHVVEVFYSRIFKEFSDHSYLYDLKSTDEIAAYELLFDDEDDSTDGQFSDSNEDPTVIIHHTDSPGGINPLMHSSRSPNSNALVHIVLLMKKPYKPLEQRNLFGTPFILSVRRNTTYKELYKIVIERLAGSEYCKLLKKIPSTDISLWPVSERPEDLATEFNDDGSIFTFQSVNVYGNASANHTLQNDDQPLDLDDREVIACSWTFDSMAAYYNDATGAEGVQTHSSVQGGRESSTNELRLVDCLRLFSEEEKLSKEDAWFCPDCKEHVEATKKFDIYKAPPILVVHLKRFSYRNKFFRERLNQVVDFPLNDFDLSEFVTGPHDEYPVKYDLYAISNHYGNLGGGHYTAFCRDREDSTQWLCFDDASVTPVKDLSRLVSQAAYVLFYKRQDVEWPKFEEEEIPSSSSSSSEDEGEYVDEEGEEEEKEGEGEESGGKLKETVNSSEEERANLPSLDDLAMEAGEGC